MENRRIIGNFLLFILIAISAYGATQFSLFLRMHGRSSFNLWPYMTAMLFLPLLFGMLVRLPALVGRWQETRAFDWVRFGFQFVPGFSLVVLPSISMLVPIRIPLYSIVVSQSLFLSLMGFWVGTVLVDCIRGAPVSEKGTSLDM